MAVAQPTAGSFAKSTRWSSFWKSISIIFDSRVATVGLAIVVFWLIIGLLSLFWTPHPPNANLFAKNSPPSAASWLGSDYLGRDILSRLMQGTQVILLKTRLPNGIGDGGELQRAPVFRPQRFGQADIHPGHRQHAVDRQEYEDPSPRQRQSWSCIWP